MLIVLQTHNLAVW